MMISFKQSKKSPKHRPLSIEEVRLIGDLRIMHSKVDELYQVVSSLTERHHEADICTYADDPVMTKDIKKVDEIYLWFVKLKDERTNNKRA